MSIKFSKYIWKITEPQNPFEKALFVWDSRVGSLITRSKNWRLFALIALISCIVQGFVNIKLLATPKIIPYIIETAESGRVINYGKMKEYENYEIDQRVLKYYLIDFIKNIKELDNNVVVTKRKWTKAYQYVNNKGAKELTRYFKEWNPIEKAENYRSEIIINSYLDRSANTKEIELTEGIYNLQGEIVNINKYKIILTVELIKGENAETDDNPLGIYVDKIVIGEKK